MTPGKKDRQRKKPYHPPKVETYGTVREITRAVTGTAKNDAKSSSTTKTG